MASLRVSTRFMRLFNVSVRSSSICSLQKNNSRSLVVKTSTNSKIYDTPKCPLMPKIIDAQPARSLISGAADDNNEDGHTDEEKLSSAWKNLRQQKEKDLVKPEDIQAVLDALKSKNQLSPEMVGQLLSATYDMRRRCNHVLQQTFEQVLDKLLELDWKLNSRVYRQMKLFYNRIGSYQYNRLRYFPTSRSFMLSEALEWALNFNANINEVEEIMELAAERNVLLTNNVYDSLTISYISAGDEETAMKILEEKYGSPETVTRRSMIIDRLFSYGLAMKGDFEGLLQRLHSQMQVQSGGQVEQQIVTTMKLLHGFNHIEAAEKLVALRLEGYDNLVRKCHISRMVNHVFSDPQFASRVAWSRNEISLLLFLDEPVEKKMEILSLLKEQNLLTKAVVKEITRYPEFYDMMTEKYEDFESSVDKSTPEQLQNLVNLIKRAKKAGIKSETPTLEGEQKIVEN